MIFNQVHNTVSDEVIWFDARFVTSDWFINMEQANVLEFSFMTTTEPASNYHTADTMPEALRVMRDSHILGEGVTA